MSGPGRPAAAAGGDGWGGLEIAGMALALPLAALREVVPCSGLRPMPCALPAIVGALDLRGVALPVLDLTRLLGQAAPPAAAPCVVVVVDRGRVLGLLADRVTGIFDSAPGSQCAALPSEAAGTPPLPPLPFAGSVRRADNGALVNLLSLAALATLPGLPWIDDPEPQRQPRSGQAADDGTSAVVPMLSLMLIRCGALRLAINAMAVQATLWEPRLLPSPLTRGPCLGVVAYDGRAIAAVDLLGLAGLPAGERAPPRQALVLAQGAGHVALLVDEVIDIVRRPASAVVAAPQVGLPRRALFQGVLPAQAPDGAAAGGGAAVAGPDVLVLDAAALTALEQLQALAATNTALQATAGPRGQAAAGDSQALITFAMPHEVAVPIDQVAEILPFGSDEGLFGPEHPVRRIQVVRGRPVPVVCLARLAGGHPGAAAASAAVLVVEADGHTVGLAVPALQAIEHSRWQRDLPVVGAAASAADGGDSVAAVLARRQVAQLGDGPTRRTVPLLDLQALARALAAEPARLDAAA